LLVRRWQVTWSPPASGIAFGATEHQGKVIRLRHNWLDSDTNTSRTLLDFRTHTRDNPFSRQYMWSAVANLSPQSRRDLATYFSTLPPKAANDGDRAVAATGRGIYQEGLPDSNIISCVACHGPNAEGVREIPRLGGLAYSYLKRRLEQWGEGYHAAAEPPMPRIASKLSPDEIEALASYLSFVK
jgi:cytochrome c553